MATIAEQIEFFRQLANQYSAEILANINSYRIIVVAQIQVYSAWFATLTRQGFQYAMTSLYHAYAWGLSLITSGWLKQQALWVLEKLIAGFWHGYNAILMLANFIIRMTHELVRFLKYLPDLLINIAEHCVHLAKSFYRFASKIITLLYRELAHLAVQAYDALVYFIQQLPAYLARMWSTITKAFILIKDAAVALMKHIGTFLSNVVFPLVRELATKAFDKIATAIGVTFGLSAAIVDISFDFLSFTYNNTLGLLLPTMPNMPLLAAGLPYLKGALTVGLVGAACYGIYQGCRKLYPHIKPLIAQAAATTSNFIKKQKPDLKSKDKTFLKDLRHALAMLISLPCVMSILVFPSLRFEFLPPEVLLIGMAATAAYFAFAYFSAGWLIGGWKFGHEQKPAVPELDPKHKPGSKVSGIQARSKKLSAQDVHQLESTPALTPLRTLRSSTRSQKTEPINASKQRKKRAGH